MLIMFRSILGLGIPCLVVVTLGGLPSESRAADKDIPITEMRVYYAKPGKLDNIHARLKDASPALMKRHGITPVAFFVPVGENKENRLVFFFSFPSMTAREKAWNDYYNDEDARKVFNESEKDGPLEGKIEMRFLFRTDYSPELKVEKSKEDRIFELRTYTATKGNLGDLNDRFKNHTMKLFEKHGMTNIVYWNGLKGDVGDDTVLIYLLAHKSVEAAKKSFDAFRQDPEWIAVRKASEEKAGGSLTEAKGGVVSEFLKPTAYSPLK
jgi:NIPSNAP protein